MYGGEKNTFMATLVASDSCNETYDWAVLSKPSHYRLIPTKNISNPDIKKSIDAKVRSHLEEIYNQNMNSDIILTGLTEMSSTKTPIYAISYKAKANWDFNGRKINGILFDDTILPIPSKGTSFIENLWAFELNNSTYLVTSSMCAECDAWSGKEVFQITKSKIELVHTKYDLLYIPE